MHIATDVINIIIIKQNLNAMSYFFYKILPERISKWNGNLKMWIFISLFHMKISHTMFSRSKYRLSYRVPVHVS